MAKQSPELITCSLENLNSLRSALRRCFRITKKDRQRGHLWIYKNTAIKLWFRSPVPIPLSFYFFLSLSHTGFLLSCLVCTKNPHETHWETGQWFFKILNSTFTFYCFVTCIEIHTPRKICWVVWFTIEYFIDRARKRKSVLTIQIKNVSCVIYESCN